ncbi:MAG TPA: hypothetical protein VGB73_10440 [Pyrinomonadaceae bacterium]|jgi:hypothetical protein
MKKRLTNILLLAASLTLLPTTADARRLRTATLTLAPVSAQCRTTDTTVPKRIRFARGRTTAVVKDAIRLCTSHEYKLRARAGQTMNVNLVTGKRTSLTISAPDGNNLLDGGKDWTGELPTSGEYIITVGTDATARYTLEVTIR